MPRELPVTSAILPLSKWAFPTYLSEPVARALFRQGARGALKDPERLTRLRDIVSRARTEVEALGEERPASPAGAPPSEPRMV